MKYFSFFVFFFLITSFSVKSQIKATSKTANGTASLKDWKPSTNTSDAAPTIDAIATKYSLIPSDNTCKLTLSMQWYLGNEVWFRGEKYAFPFISLADIQHFSIVDLELELAVYANNLCVGTIRFNIGKTPKAGGVWGNDVVETRSWENVFEDVSATETKYLFSKNLTIEKVKIKKITFGGSSQFRNAIYQKLVERAKQEKEEYQLEKALKTFGLALMMKPHDSFIISEQKDIQQTLQKYNSLKKLADEEFETQMYLSASEHYKKVLELIPNVPEPKERIRLIAIRLAKFNKISLEAEALFSHKNNTDDLFLAITKFKEALQYLPNDKGYYVENKLREVQGLLENNYSKKIQAADHSFQSKNYTEAVKSYQYAAHIFPKRTYPKQQIENIENIVLESIHKIYTDELNTAARVRDIAFGESAKALNSKSENCYLQRALYNDCRINYFQKLKKNAYKEMRAMLYNEIYTVASLDCQEVNCELGKEPNQPNAKEYLLAAKRKHKLHDSYFNESYKNHRDEYLEKSIELYPRNSDAFVFKSRLASTFIDKEILLNTALSFHSSHKEALNNKAKIQNDFFKEIFDKVLQSDSDYFLKAIRNSLLKEVTSLNNLTILEQAAKHEKSYILDLLLKNKVALNKATYTNIDALLYFSVENKADLSVDFLLNKKGANPNTSFVDKEPMIILATKNQDYQNVSLLVEGKADLGVKGAEGKSALDIAVLENYTNIVKALLKGVEVNEVSDKYIFTAIENNAYELSKILISKGVNINKTDESNTVPLHLAIEKGYTRIAKLLIENKANLNFKDKQETTALLLATKQNNSAISLLLIGNDASIDAKNNKGESPLSWAISNRMPKVIAALLHQNVEVKDVMEFIKKQQNQRFIDNASFMIMKFAIEKERIDLAELTLNYKPTIGYEEHHKYPNMLRYAIQNNGFEIFKLLTANSSKKVTQQKGYSALHIAIDEKSLKFTQHLLDQLANLPTKDLTGATPLIHAVKVGFAESIAPILIKSKINQQDYKNRTALHWAVETGNEEIVSILLSHNADKTIKDNRGWTVKKLAKKKKFRKIKKLL